MEAAWLKQGVCLLQCLYPELSTALPEHLCPVSSHIQVSTLESQTPGPRALIGVPEKFQCRCGPFHGGVLALLFLVAFFRLSLEVVHDLWVTDLEIS